MVGVGAPRGRPMAVDGGAAQGVEAGIDRRQRVARLAGELGFERGEAAIVLDHGAARLEKIGGER